MIRGLIGIMAILAIAFLLSKDKKNIKLRPIIVGLAMLIGFAAFVMKTTIGVTGLTAASNGIQHFMDYSKGGIEFVFGDLATGNFVFFFHALMVIVFVSSLVSLLYYFGIMQRVVNALGTVISKAMGVSKLEGVNAVGCVALGASEAPILIKPYLTKLSNAELFTIMTSALASVAGSILIGYAALGIDLKYLLTAAVMAIPAALLIAKIIMPSTEKSEVQDIALVKDKESANMFDAMARGAQEGIQIVVSVAAMLMAFIAIVAFANGIIGGIGSLFGVQGLSLELILGYVFAPLAWLIGVPAADVMQAASFIGQKTVLNEFVAFGSLVDATMSPKATMIVTFALCGFANFSVIAILLGSIGALAPSIRPRVAKLGLLALAGGLLANLLSAAVAGMMF
ncbi:MULTISPECIES: NupC/NupG family nucleoside CNT transporter [Bacillus cereus group]|uniref:NupC/NupG family nucleoside CNT transporter n=1 Tax=Bacillus cereus group TaxID=86661 RepID=UPI000BEE26C7|nr:MULTISPECIES: nucleoside transporter C-terminal domain-containing protein [Bacillus cereus group]PEF88557.1 NupC/NupG family nucleoside CNT transporter [Bacillus thuringiensis]PES54734.1 NupC/NupG family nucleoside CNT transporter [Bacillus thuringiensis]PFP03574.1 NupC/NupG family nucleoside CNT transporter [Bacillus thuringiensis]PFS55690.1 NupC/NupG family nucleoside CNT transporter [Bacillus thuringiensis]PGL62342.1 NupC/NupG family nucleoside CNT transporter [Bacillus thuringiensis]